MQDSGVDVAIVGAGPAGSAAAVALRRQGLTVAVLERSRFPRHKICGDFLTPGAVARLKEIGGGAVEAESPATLRGMRITYEGTQILSDFPDARHGWSLSRRTLDEVLARRAEAAGADLVRELRAETFTRLSEGGWLVAGSHPDGTRRRWRARLLVDAGGRHGIIARRVGWREDDRRLERYALWSHMEGVRGLGERGEMHVFEGGYVGVAALDPSGVANVTMVLTPRRMARARGDARGCFLELLRRHPELGRRCRDARLITPVRGLGPLACSARRLAAGGLALVGDAGGFIDPFTGEGVNIALTSARMLAAAVERHGLEAGAGRALAAYEREHRLQFASKFRLCRLLQVVIARPWLARRVAGALSSRKDLADKLVGATGDLLPASEVLGPAWIGRLLIAALAPAAARAS